VIVVGLRVAITVSSPGERRIVVLHGRHCSGPGGAVGPVCVSVCASRTSVPAAVGCEENASAAHLKQRRRTTGVVSVGHAMIVE